MKDRIPYWQKLQDPRWQRKRLEILQRDSWTCSHCSSKEKRLEVHHLYYISGREPWEYCDSALQTLCKDCHEEVKSTNYPDSQNLWENFTDDLFAELCFEVMTFIHCHDIRGDDFIRMLGEVLRYDLINASQRRKWISEIRIQRAKRVSR